MRDKYHCMMCFFSSTVLVFSLFVNKLILVFVLKLKQNKKILNFMNLIRIDKYL
jgi:hypothetical protein